MLNEDRYKNMTNNEQILFHIADDIALHLQSEEGAPVSPSLILWHLGFDSPTLKDELMSAINRTILRAEEPLKLTVNDFSQAFAEVSSEFGNPKQDKQLIIELLTWFGLHVYPLAYPIAKNIENE